MAGETNQIYLGDKVILVQRGKMPEKVEVVRITPARKELLIRYKEESWRFISQKDGWIEKGKSRNPARLYQYSKSEMSRLVDNYEKEQEALKEVEKSEKEKRKAIERRVAEEIAEVKQIMTGKIIAPLILPDGSRFYFIDLPVREEFRQRKKDYEILMLRCWNEKEFYDEKEKFRGAATWINGASCSFPSQSTLSGADDFDIIWEAIRARYNNNY